MGVNISQANYQAAQLRAYATRLNQVKSYLVSYKSSLDSNWRGDEIKLIDSAIDTINRRIQNLQALLNSTATNIIASANQIRKEEIAAEEARRRAEETRRRAEEAARQRQAQEAQRRAAELAAQKAMAEAEKERKAMDDLLKKIEKVTNKSKKKKLLEKAKEPNITSEDLEKFYKKIMGK